MLQPECFRSEIHAQAHGLEGFNLHDVGRDCVRRLGIQPVRFALIHIDCIPPSAGERPHRVNHAALIDKERTWEASMRSLNAAHCAGLVVKMRDMFPHSSEVC